MRQTLSKIYVLGFPQACVIPQKVWDENEVKIKMTDTYTRESGHGKPPLKDEKEDLFVARDIESLFIKGTRWC